MTLDLTRAIQTYVYAKLVKDGVPDSDLRTVFILIMPMIRFLFILFSDLFSRYVL